MEFNFYKTKIENTVNQLKVKLFDNIQDAFFVLTVSPNNDYDLPFVNDSAYEMFEISEDEIFINKVFYIYNQIHQEDKKLVKQSLFDSIKEGKRWDTIFRVELPIKGLCWFKISSTSEINSDQSIIFYGRITDITDSKIQHTDIGTYDASQKEKEESKVINKTELSSQNNNRLLNFSHIVSHNLNSHAGNFKLLLDMLDLEDSFAQKRETMKYLRIVSNDLNKTIEDLSQIVNIQNNKDIVVKPLNLSDYLSRVLNIVSAYSFKNNATIVNNVPKDATINFNPAYLESVLQNLCTNAIKYANPEKSLIIEFNFFVENEQKVFTIKDNGLGIDLEKYGHLLFGMYKTFHKHENANGIGLYITKNQIESMNGRVTVESQLGKGTTFKIIFNG
ncbi:PAS domain-containing sensor histidine kinase [Flavobacterium sp. Fl-77]|uniref:histidine kinase n=1 Tax=Flavobacterium flavipigmentatum TaxID=2893884 RepID=A0AAJ2SH89_9FLAO|nr:MULTISPECIES: PAS domain-containing sensor histidine kinase [unclassified Flavobacterium]MDX6182631.1 PAS domain-containing sensor histidine kinase [Flavobacterium sp. Fl-33]MDX6186189.1 PAS domain-containing sensor histidine kinase [Flavobacterium sp. Fl-77]UFH38336.1 PAS domain-containing sensor histidine kinase [Flavobacterium sp. F-70]